MNRPTLRQLKKRGISIGYCPDYFRLLTGGALVALTTQALGIAIDFAIKSGIMPNVMQDFISQYSFVPMLLGVLLISFGVLSMALGLFALAYNPVGVTFYQGAFFGANQQRILWQVPAQGLARIEVSTLDGTQKGSTLRQAIELRFILGQETDDAVLKLQLVDHKGSTGFAVSGDYESLSQLIKKNPEFASLLVLHDEKCPMQAYLKTLINQWAIGGQNKNGSQVAKGPVGECLCEGPLYAYQGQSICADCLAKKLQTTL